MMAALSCYEKFARENGITVEWPISVVNVQKFINWAVLEKEYATSTVRAYINHLATLHKLKNLSEASCKNFVNNAMLNGAENLTFYSDKAQKQKNVMTLPLLRVLGHELKKSNWSNHSKLVIWGSCTAAFFGSFRLGELLSKNESKFLRNFLINFNKIQHTVLIEKMIIHAFFSCLDFSNSTVRS